MDRVGAVYIKVCKGCVPLREGSGVQGSPVVGELRACGSAGTEDKAIYARNISAFHIFVVYFKISVQLETKWDYLIKRCNPCSP